MARDIRPSTERERETNGVVFIRGSLGMWLCVFLVGASVRGVVEGRGDGACGAKEGKGDVEGEHRHMKTGTGTHQGMRKLLL